MSENKNSFFSFLSKVGSSFHAIFYSKEILGLKNETAGEYKAKLIAERGQLYGLLHTPGKINTTTLTKDEIRARMAEIGKLLDPVYELQMKQHFLGREL